MDHTIQNYRQPIVTSIGIILGFVLGFTGKRATDPVGPIDNTDYFISIGLLCSIIFLMIALFRILSNKYPQDNSGIYYFRTLVLFIIGVCLAFSGIFVSLFDIIFLS